MRTFIAIELPEAVLDDLGALSKRLRASGAKASWVRCENMHLTLRFLGEIDDRAVARICEHLADGYRNVSPFELSVHGVGAFPNTRKPSVVWAGVGPVEPDLAAVQDLAETAAIAIGLPKEKRPFHPHLTLARIRDARSLGDLRNRIEEEREFAGGAFAVGAVSLFSSRLTPRGAIYNRLKEFRF